MKICPIEPQVELYEEGFEENDILQRAAVGRSLSNLVERIEDPLVIALDGGWGTGKTYFLKRWVGAHALENNGAAKTLYFDAFAHDYLSDPLPALVSAIGERFPKADESTINKVKSAAFKLARPFARFGMAMATYGATEALAPVGDAAVAAINTEASIAIENYWSREDGRRAAMEEFHSALAELVAVQYEGGNERAANGARLVIVVDELDRCRPDYALEVLEVMKHFFVIPSVTFILGVNLVALENSVKARYGADIDASAYLRKFINVSLSLPAKIGHQHSMRETVLVYLEHQTSVMGIPDHIGNALKRHIKVVARNNSVSIRDVGKILSAVSLLGGDVLEKDDHLSGWLETLTALLVSKVVRPDIYEKFLSSSISAEDLEEYFDASIQRRSYRINDEYNEEFDRYTMTQFYLWLYIANGGRLPHDDADLQRYIGGLLSPWSSGPNDAKEIPRKVQRKWLDVFRTEEA